MVRRLFALVVVLGGVAVIADQLTPISGGMEPAGPLAGSPQAGWVQWARAWAGRLAYP